jgi:Amt family ammonium transporter
MSQVLGIAAVAILTWVLWDYSLAFYDGNALVGGLGKAGFSGVEAASMWAVGSGGKAIPELAFAAFQMSFAAITGALVIGALVERVRFGAIMLFSLLWQTIVYAPLAHMVWASDGFLFRFGAIDFAGGTVVHINSGIAGLVGVAFAGPRIGHLKEAMPPHSLALTMVGAGLLWVGWFGFNGGSALAASPRAVSAIVDTHLAACAGACTWMALEWATRGKPSVLGMISGAVAGLGTITPASGFVTPMEGVLIGVIAGGVCYWSCTWLKIKCGYDDSLDVFGVHGIGGLTGSFLVGVLAIGAVSAGPELPGGVHGLIEGNISLVGSQLLGIAVTALWSGGVTWIILKVISVAVPLRVRTEDEVMGLDVSQHGEALQ